jgi:hypothetical protein
VFSAELESQAGILASVRRVGQKRALEGPRGAILWSVSNVKYRIDISTVQLVILNTTLDFPQKWFRDVSGLFSTLVLREPHTSQICFSHCAFRPHGTPPPGRCFRIEAQAYRSYDVRGDFAPTALAQNSTF